MSDALSLSLPRLGARTRRRFRRPKRPSDAVIALWVLRCNVLLMLARCAWDLPTHPLVIMPMMLFAGLWWIISVALRYQHLLDPKVDRFEWFALAGTTVCTGILLVT